MDTRMHDDDTPLWRPRLWYLALGLGVWGWLALSAVHWWQTPQSAQGLRPERHGEQWLLESPLSPLTSGVGTHGALMLRGTAAEPPTFPLSNGGTGTVSALPAPNRTRVLLDGTMSHASAPPWWVSNMLAMPGCTSGLVSAPAGGGPLCK
jgi:hypothetical protein